YVPTFNGEADNILKIYLNNTRFDNAIIDLNTPNAYLVRGTLSDGSTVVRSPDSSDHVQLPAGTKDIIVSYRLFDEELTDLISIDAKLTRGADEVENTIIFPGE